MNAFAQRDRAILGIKRVNDHLGNMQSPASPFCYLIDGRPMAPQQALAALMGRGLGQGAASQYLGELTIRLIEQQTVTTMGGKP